LRQYVAMDLRAAHENPGGESESRLWLAVAGREQGKPVKT
jgi:hypothetical protein